MSHKIIYSLMYSPIVDHYYSIEDQIISINTSALEWNKDKTNFVYIWGYPGPDYNRYTKDTYGKGWAFTKEEILKAWKK